MTEQFNVTKYQAMGEQVIIKVPADNDDKTYIPSHGTIVAIGEDVQLFQIGDVVLLPTGAIKNVADPRAVSGLIKLDDDSREILVHTHFMNISVKYTK